MANSDLSAKHISANLASYEAARTGFFSLIIDDLDNLVSAAFSGERNEATDNDKIARAQEVLKLNVVKAPVPHFDVKVEEFRRGNDVVKFAGVPTFQSGGNIVIDDIVGLDTKSILMAWQALTYNVYTRKGGRMKDYKKNCTLVEYTQDFEQIRSWTLYGCWLSGISEGDFDKENDGKRQISAKLEYDRAEMNLD
jgi:hypothetical protein